uniref:Uncharacterized protein n=1 Tax=Panagrolaimus sp. JU765 TaxID=591449 RepID=A0AC34R630_9BILA
MAQELNKSLTDDQKMMSEFEKSLKIGHEGQNKKDTPLEDKMNLLKLQSEKNDLLNPVRLCPSLYADILAAIVRNHRNFDEIIKFAMVGEEALVAIVSLFQEAEELVLHKQVGFGFGNRLSDCNYYSIYCDRSDNFVKKLVTVAIPFVKRVSFGGSNEKWQDFCFEVLSKDSRQKELEISGLEKVDDLAKITLKNLVEKGVLIKFKFAENQIWNDLPPYQYESLKFYDRHRRFLTRMKPLKCGFNVLEFSDLSTWDKYVKYMKPFFANLKRVFPKSEKLVIELTLRVYYDDDDFYPDVKGCLLDIVKFVNDAPQNQIDLSVSVDRVHSRSDVPEIFTEKDDYEYFWKSKSNENKVIKLEIESTDSDIDYFDSSDDYVDYDF